VLHFSNSFVISSALLLFVMVVQRIHGLTNVAWSIGVENSHIEEGLEGSHGTLLLFVPLEAFPQNSLTDSSSMFCIQEDQQQ
jgi:hypothetical protein